MTKVPFFCLDKNYSTTQLLTKEIPYFEGQSKEKSIKQNEAFETALFLPKGEGRQGEGGLRIQGYFKKSYEDKPLVSVITVVFNGDSYLEETIQSVIKQTYDNVEYIIIDGGSTDSTLDIIKKYEDRIDYWVSEKDKGISDAFNKGKKVVKGKYHLFLNADDYFHDYITLNNITRLFCKDVDVINLGATLSYNNNNNNKNILPKKMKYIYKMPTSHQSMLFNTKKLENYEYNVCNKLTMDYEFLLRYVDLDKMLYSNENLSTMRMIGASSKNTCQVTLSYLSLNIKYNGFISFLESIAYMLKACINKYRSKYK